MRASGTELWASEPFHRDVTAWVSDVARQHRIDLTGGAEQPHNRPWSSAIRYGSSAGSLWFKVNGPGTVHEPGLVAELARLVPDLGPEVLEVDIRRGWALTRDAGPTVRSLAPPEELWPVWEEVLPRYAEAQLQLARHLDSLLDTRVPARRPAVLADEATRLVKDLADIDPAEGGLTADQVDALEAVLPAYRDWSAELSASPVPDSLQHDDLHSGNVCRSADGTLRIIDWGDASLGFPLATLLVTLNSVADAAGSGTEDPRVLRVRDAYLEPFTGLASRAELVRYVDLARRCGCVTRALSWRGALTGEPASTHAAFGYPVRGWLLETLEVLEA